MPKKTIEVVELNKKEEKIILAESQSALLLFWRRHRDLIFSILLCLTLTVFGVSLTLFLRNVGSKVRRLEKDRAETVKRLEKELKQVKNGWSFRIGRVITYVPRNLKKWFTH